MFALVVGAGVRRAPPAEPALALSPAHAPAPSHSPSFFFTVQLATFLKRKFALEPALKAVRRQREQERPGTESEQVRRMF